ncbi:MAG: archaetidylinositol phosphate synthase [Candidatus Nezhaarchaeales archaeon]
MLSKLRERYEQLVTPLSVKAAKLGVSPNAITLLGLVLSVACAYTFYTRLLALGALLIMVVGAIDAFDGAVARASGKVTRFGSVLDSVLDRYTEYLILAGLVLGGFIDAFLGFFAFFGMVMVSYVRAKAEGFGLKWRGVGIVERQERLILLAIGAVVTTTYHDALNYIAIVIGVLSQVTVVQRLIYVRSKGGL